MRRRLRVAALLPLISACIVAASPALSAQSADVPSPVPHHVTVSAGLLWSGGYAIGDRTVELRGNAVGPTAPPFTLFRAESSVDASAGVTGRAGFAVTRDVTVEFGVSYQQPGITTSLAQDAEAPAVTIDAERLSQYVFDAAVLWQLPRFKFGTRARPFVIGGGGYLRQLYQERTLVEHGSVYYAGAGIRYWLRGGDGSTRAFGIRADGRLQWRLDGVEFESKTRVGPGFTALAFFEF